MSVSREEVEMVVRSLERIAKALEAIARSMNPPRAVRYDPTPIAVIQDECGEVRSAPR